MLSFLLYNFSKSSYSYQYIFTLREHSFNEYSKAIKIEFILNIKWRYRFLTFNGSLGLSYFQNIIKLLDYLCFFQGCSQFLMLLSNNSKVSNSEIFLVIIEYGRGGTLFFSSLHSCSLLWFTIICFNISSNNCDIILIKI